MLLSRKRVRRKERCHNAQLSGSEKYYKYCYSYKNMKQEPHHIFVYGSLRSGFHHPAYEYISRYFLFEGNAKIKGVLFDMGTYPAAMPATGEHYIIGELYSIKKAEEFSWAMGQLDDYEGVDAEEEESVLFKRELANVYTGENKNIKAWVYWYNGDTTGKPVIASGDVLDYFYKKNNNPAV